MASRRMISRSLGTSEKYAQLIKSENGLAEFCHSLFPLMVVNADDSGRLQGDAFTVKFSIFPISERSVDDFENALLAMHRVGLIARYRSGLRWYIQIINFTPHQPGLLKETKTQLPSPDAAALAHIREFSRFPAHSREFPQTRENAGESPRIPSKEGRKEGRSRSRSSGYLDRSGTIDKSPLPPFLRKGGDRRKKLSKSELAEAERWRRLSLKPCQHEPRCENVGVCVQNIAYELRETRRTSK